MSLTSRRSLQSLFLATLLLLLSEWALASAGKVLFVSGPVSVERNGTRALNKGDAIEVGDVIVTGEKARAQILMADGAKIALRSGTRFRIDEFTMPPAVTAPAQATVVNANGKSVASLLKGGFRTQTGTIGRTDRAAYEVRTPIGTLGIRGTDYTAVFCVGDCSDAPGLQPGEVIRDGLYLGVTEGAIGFVGGDRQIELKAGEYAFIPLSGARPEPLQAPPAFLEEDGAGPLTIGASGGGEGGKRAASSAASVEMGDFNERRSPSDTSKGEPGEETSTGPDVEQPVTGTGPNGRPVDVTDGSLPSPRQNLSFSIGSAGPTPGFDASLRTLEADVAPDAAGNLVAFGGPLESGGSAAPVVYTIGSSVNTDTGSNAATGLRWGRWNTGTASVTTPTSTVNQSLANQSWHWIVGASSELDVVLPIGGTVTYTPVGNTQPTDTLGNVGALRGAFLSADFTNRSVTSTLTLDINQVNWFATGTAPLTANSNVFSANFSNVTVGGVVTGSGSFSGFFEQGASLAGQAPDAVGLSYTLAEPTASLGIVSGVIAFAQGAGQPPGPPPAPRRDITFAVGQLGNANGVDAAASNQTPPLLTDATGNVTQFVAPLTRTGATGTLALGTSTNVNTGSNAAIALQWGRWQGGAANITPPAPGQPFTQQLAGQSLHWLVGPAYSAAPVLPQTGTASYVLVGNTNPTDTRANVGTLGSASFSADFTNRTVASALTLNIDGRDWFASGNGTFAAGSNQFGGNYANVQIGGLITGGGSLSGFFVVPGFGGAVTAGAGLSYNLADSLFQLGVVSGVLAFQQGTGQPVGPPALQRRDIAFSVLNLSQGPPTQFALANPAGFYAVDAAFDLTRLTGVYVLDPPEAATYDIGTATVAESAADAVTMLRWGRWSGGNMAVTTLTSGQTFTESLAQQSLHWIESANAPNPPTLPASGTAIYTFVGGTRPTDTLGNVGTLNSASFDADFTNQLVNAALDLTVNNNNWVVAGTGTIGAQVGLAPHQFSGALSGVINPTGFAANGSFVGFFSQPGGTVAGVPGGAALTYQLSEGQQLVAPVTGAVVFRGP
jgi:hypothetical protein